jgi:hypothetical protein
MSRQSEVYQWVSTIAEHLPQLSKAQATVLGLWSFGIVMVGACGCTTVASFLALTLAQKENTLRQRLREWYYEAKAKRGQHRQTLDVTTCFVPLLRWVLAWWAPEEHRLALALDATSLAQRFTVLAISVVYRGCAIPIAWTVLNGTEANAWKPHWLNLLHRLTDAIPSTWSVIVLADRGLYAHWLFDQIVQLAWHPFLRINRDGKFRTDQCDYRPLSSLAVPDAPPWCGRVVCFKARPLTCTLLAYQDTIHEDPWLVITDLLPDQAQVCWYGLRTWIECGFKDFKRGGWQWQTTRIVDPARASRFWLALAVATLWMVSVGGVAEMNLSASNLDELPATHIARRCQPREAPPRLLSCFRRGRLAILAALFAGQSLPIGYFQPEPWPDPLKNQQSIPKTYP